ncbi:MAG: delta-class carbonic anhydrase [Acidobacteriota bacterium]
MRNFTLLTAAAVLIFGAGAASADVCQGFGPQTPRDISSTAGENARVFSMAPAHTEMNLCNIHFHKHAEHKGPGFSVFKGSADDGGYACNDADKLSKAEMKKPSGDVCKGLAPGDTIEVHWVHSSCDVGPGPTLGACLSDACANPDLRVETQVFVLVNDDNALDFADFDAGAMKGGMHQAKGIPADTGSPVQFLGSTTGPSYTEQTCSPLQVSWSVRPQCAKLDINTVAAWCQDNVFNEDHGHGVRQLVTDTRLLSAIK